MSRAIYADYNATTPVDPSVREAMRPAFEDLFGNPSSSHWLGVKARMAVAQARSRAAALLGCAPIEFYFTSGGSESNNWAIKGAAWALRGRGNHLVTSAVEHFAVLNPCRFLESFGFETTIVPVDGRGRVDPDDVARAIRPGTVLVSIMHANNEVGTIQPVGEISMICRERGILFHVDAAQSVGKIPVNVSEIGCDLLTAAGHKFHAPKGIGGLFIREGAPVEALVHGAGHERGRRAGTENVAGALALARAADLAGERLAAYGARIAALRRRFVDALCASVRDVVIYPADSGADVLPNTVNLRIGRIDGALLAERMEGVAVSAGGAACHGSARTPSHVLTAMGVPADQALGAVRFSFGWENTEDEIDDLAARIVRAALSIDSSLVMA
ncbi:MAG: cysteine desulfurase [Nitrospirae bacterium]|nr:cysteine desulfurase [Nitrospirota bacterium]